MYLNKKVKKIIGLFMDVADEYKGKMEQQQKSKRSGWIMGIGKIDNYRFYEGYEDEPEIEILTDDENMEALHIWDGFFDDIFREPSLDGKGWKGFTRDYHQCEGSFGDAGEAIISKLQEYIDDLKIYKNRKFDYEETKDVYALLVSWLTEAKEKGCEVRVRVI